MFQLATSRRLLSSHTFCRALPRCHGKTTLRKLAHYTLIVILTSFLIFELRSAHLEPTLLRASRNVRVGTAKDGLDSPGRIVDDTEQTRGTLSVKEGYVSSSFRQGKGSSMDCWVYNKPFKTAGTSIMNALLELNAKRGGISAPDDLEYFLGPSRNVSRKVLQLKKIDFFGSHIRLSDDVLSAFESVCRGKLVLLTSIREPLDIYRSWYMQKNECLYPGKARIVKGKMKETSYRMWLSTANRFLILDYMDGKTGDTLPLKERIRKITDMYDYIIDYHSLNSSFAKVQKRLHPNSEISIAHINERGTNFDGLPNEPEYVEELHQVVKYDKLLYAAMLSKSVLAGDF